MRFTSKIASSASTMALIPALALIVSVGFLNMTSTARQAYAQSTSVTVQTNAQTTGTVLGASTNAANASAEELKQKIAEQAKNIEALNKEIQQYAEMKDKTTAEAKTLQPAIK